MAADIRVSSDYNGCVKPALEVALHCKVTDLLNSVTKWVFNGKPATLDCHVYDEFKDALHFSKCDAEKGIFDLVIKSFDDDKMGRWSCIHEGHSKSIVFDGNNVCCEYYLSSKSVISLFFIEMYTE